MDKFLSCEFKEARKARYENNKLINNVSNYGAKTGDILFVGRNGEYLNIAVQIFSQIDCLFNDINVHKIYLNIETNYVNNMEIINKFNLINVYQKYQNEIFRFIVDKFLEINEINKFYNDYPNIIKNFTKDNDLINLAKRIKYDCHELLPVKLKVVNCGSLLPENWLYKEFNSGEEFHKAIDKLETRINKPPVTYLCNYCMLILQTKPEPKVNEIKDMSNIWLLKENYKFSKVTVLPENTTNLTWILVNFKDKPIYIIYNPLSIFNSKPELKSLSIGYNCSLLQKSIRRGIGCYNSLMLSIDNLSSARPFNNPEYNYALVSGSKQLVWRMFISIIEDVCIYKSNEDLDIFDLVAYSKIFADFPEKNIHNDLVNKIKNLATKILFIKDYVNFRKYECANDFKISTRFHQALFIANEYMPGMAGDKKMIKSLETWLNLCDKNKYIMLDLDKVIVTKDKIKPNEISDLILRCNANDHHCNPEIISDYHNLMYDGKIKLEDCSKLIWDSNSSFNYRYHKFKCNEDLLFLQFINNKNISNDITSIFKNKNLNDTKDKKYDIIFNLINNSFNLEYQKLLFSQKLLELKQIEKVNNKNINYSNVIQILLSNSYNNNIFFNNKKTIPIYTFDKLKFKIGETIYDCEDNEEIYKKIFQKYTSSLNGQIIKLDKFTQSIINFNKTNIKLGFINDAITFDDSSIITFTDIYEYKINVKELDKFLKKTKMNNYQIKTGNYIYDTLKQILEQKPNKFQSWLTQKALSKPEIKNDYIIQSNLLELINPTIIKILISRILTSLDDKNNKTILFCGKVDRNGNSNKEAVEPIHEGYLLKILNVLNVLYGCIIKISDTKYEINKQSTSFSYLMNELKNIIKNKADITSTKTNKIKIKTKLWTHQEKVREQIIFGIDKFNQRGFGDASEVGSGKTLTALSIIEALDIKTTSDTNFLVLIPNDNLFKVWNDEINSHCNTVNVHNQNSTGKWNSIDSNSKTNIWITTMGRNRDHPKLLYFDFVIIDECLSVQNKDSKWTMKAFEQAVGSKYGILMLSATFFRTRFDKLFFMLKMLESGVPEKPEYLDTILNTIIGANIKLNKKTWTIEYNKIEETKDFYKKYNSLRNTITNKVDLYVELQKFMNNNVNYTKIILDRIFELIKENKKVIYFAQSKNEVETLENYILTNKIENIGFYPEIEKDACVISIHSGSYGINNLVKYNSILLRPTESDKIPQIKGRIDRPTQICNNLYLEYIIIKDTIQEIDLVKLEIANNFYKSHIVPLANYYDKYL